MGKNNGANYSVFSISNCLTPLCNTKLKVLEVLLLATMLLQILTVDLAGNSPHLPLCLREDIVQQYHLGEKLFTNYVRKKVKWKSTIMLQTDIACEQALLFGRVKRVSRERASERQSRHEPAKGELATIPYKFSFVLRPDEGKYHWLKNDVPEIKVD